MTADRPPPPLGGAATRVELASARPAAELCAFAERNRSWFGSRFGCPSTPEGWGGVAADPGQRWYALVERDEVVGLVVLTRLSGAPWRSAELGFAVDEAHRGRGCLQRGLAELLPVLLRGGLRRLEARVHPDDPAPARSLARAGFQLEGRARGCQDGPDGRIDQHQWAFITSDLSRDEPAGAGHAGARGGSRA